MTATPNAATQAAAPPPATSGNVNDHGNNNNNNNNNNSNNNNNRRNNNNNNNNSRSSTTVQLSNPKNYEGSIAEIGAILALKFEKLDKKVQFQVFIDKVSNYVYSNIKNGGDLIPLFKDMVDPETKFKSKRKPIKLDEAQKDDELEKDIYKEHVKVYVAGLTLLTRNQEKVFGVICGQCSAALQSKIKSLAEFEDKSSSLDSLWLLKELKKATAGIDVKAEPRSTLIDSLFGIFKMRQGATESNDCYIERFKSNVSTVELSRGANVFCCTELMDKVGSSPTPDEISAESDRFKAMLLLKCADDKRYGGLSSDLKNGAALGRNEYPVKVSDMYELMCSHCPSQPTGPRRNNNNNNADNNSNRNGIGLLQHGTRSSVHLLQLGVMLTQSDNIIDPNWVLLDTCSTDSVFNNASFLSDIVACKKDDVLNILSNGGGSVTYDTIGNFNLLPMPIYFNEKSMANVLSFKQVAGLDGVRIILWIQKWKRPIL